MVEVQSHGFSFEKWVRDAFFDGYRGSYMQKWDVPPDRNVHPSIPERWRNLPVSIKTKKYGCAVELGDVLRQRQIDHPFLMIVGFWRQRTPEEKWIEEIGVAYFSIQAWVNLWGQLSLERLREIDAVVKDLSQHYTVVRDRAKQWKKNTPAVATSAIVVNPKIDSVVQRRIQCSLPFQRFWLQVERTPVPSDTPTLFGISFPNPIISSRRTFNA